MTLIFGFLLIRFLAGAKVSKVHVMSENCFSISIIKENKEEGLQAKTLFFSYFALSEKIFDISPVSVLLSYKHKNHSQRALLPGKDEISFYCWFRETEAML